MEIKFCSKCTISNFRPSTCVEFKNNNINKEYIQFNKGICSACYVNSDYKTDIDWEQRKESLNELLSNIHMINI